MRDGGPISFDTGKLDRPGLNGAGGGIFGVEDDGVVEEFYIEVFDCVVRVEGGLALLLLGDEGLGVVSGGHVMSRWGSGEGGGAGET